MKRIGVKVNATSSSQVFPDDAILEVNGEGVKYAPVKKAVETVVLSSSSDKYISYCRYHHDCCLTLRSYFYTLVMRLPSV